MIDFGIKDIVDILIVALLLFYLYRLMKNSGTLSLFYGVLAFIVLWVVCYEIFGMRLTGTIVDKFMSIGLIVLVILFQDQIKRFLIDIGGPGKFKHFTRMFRHEKNDDNRHAEVMAVVYACMSMAKSKTGALIVFQRKVPLGDYEKTGDEIIAAVGCILPVSHDMNIPKNLGLRHRAALGMSQVTDAVCVIVSEETGGISVAHSGSIKVKISVTELEHILSTALN